VRVLTEERGGGGVSCSQMGNMHVSLSNSALLKSATLRSQVVEAFHQYDCGRTPICRSAGLRPFTSLAEAECASWRGTNGYSGRREKSGGRRLRPASCTDRLPEVVVKHGHRAAFSILLVVLVCGLRVAAAEHPVPLAKDADCASCHEDKTKGKAVHSAIAMGCTTCHEVKTEGETTTVNLTAPADQLCLTCHDKSKDEVQHGPYNKGQCITCHDPHTSEFGKQLRAEGNGLCLACHAERRNPEAMVKLFGSQTLAKAEFLEIPKILPNAAMKTGHPFAKHPVAEIPDPLRKEKMSCLSCHEPHYGKEENLMVIAKSNNGDICGACHEAFEAGQQAEGKKKYGDVEEKNQKEAQDRQKKSVNEQPATTSPKGPNQP